MSFLKTKVDLNNSPLPIHARKKERAEGDIPSRPKTDPEKIKELNSADQDNEKTEEENIFSAFASFLSKTGIKITTFSSIALNLISAPLRVVSGDNPIKNFVNKISMFATRAHLAVYSLAGINSAVKQKNPFWLFSFAAEMLISFMGNLRNIYEARGLATAADQIPAAMETLLGTTKFGSFSEGASKTFGALKQTYQEIFKNPSLLFSQKNERHILTAASTFMALGGVFGLTVNDKIGGTIRDVSGMFGDVGLALKKDKTAKLSGYSYLFGSVVDLIARGFTNVISVFFPPSIRNVFERARNGLHELAIALDRMGQFLFLTYIQDKEGKKESRNLKENLFDSGGVPQ